MNKRHHHLYTLALILALALPRITHAQTEPAGVIVLANTDQPVDGDTADADGLRIPVTVGYNQGGYNLTGFSLHFTDNTGADFSNITISLYSANSPENLDQLVSTFDVPTPGAAGLYTYQWPTNVFLPPQMTDYAPTYYTFFVIPTFQIGSTKALNLDYTTSTNYTFNDSWTFYPEDVYINGEPGPIPFFNIYATVLPPPKISPIKLTNQIILADKSFQFGFTNTPNLNFSVYATPDLKTPFTNWLFAGNTEYLGTNYYLYNSGPGLVTNSTYPRLYFQVTYP